MNAKMKYFILALSLFCSIQMSAQTTDLIYHLGSNQSTINIASATTGANGDIVVCGDYTGTDVDFDPLGVHTLQSSSGTGSGFIGLYDKDGKLKKVVTFGTSNNTGVKVYVDPVYNNIYMLAKIFGGAVNFAGSGFGTSGGSGSMALVKYDSKLTYKSSKKFFDGTGNMGDVLTDISIFGANLYVTGQLFSTNVEFNPGGTSKLLSATGLSDIIVAKYDTATMTNIWAYVVGGPDSDGGAAIDLDNAGNIYLTGFFTGQTVDIDPIGSKNVSEAGQGIASGDIFVAKYNSSMACQWAFNIGAVGEDKSTDLVVANSNVYVSGYVKNDLLNVYFDPTSTTNGVFPGINGYDLFAASYSLNGNYQWHNAIGSAGDDRATGLGIDLGGNVVVAGYASGNLDFGNSKTITTKGGKDAFFAVLSGTTGIATSVYNLGGTVDEYANAVAVDPLGKIVVVGNYVGAGDYDISTVNTTSPSGTQDGFITRHVLCLPPSIGTQPTDKSICEGLSTSLTVTATNATTYQWQKGGSNIAGATNATYTISTATTNQSGSYSVLVGNTCQTITSSAVTLTVNPKPIVNSAATSASCSGIAIAYTATSVIASNYAWTRAAKGNILPATAGNGNSASISETLTNSTDAAIDVVYSIIPTSTVGGCVGDAFNVTHTVNPKPAINSALIGTVCSGVAQSYAITSTVASNISWSRSLVAGVTNDAINNQTSTTITEKLINNTSNSVNVIYTITPTSVTNGCIGNSFSYKVTVVPAVTPTVTISSNSSTICAGSTVNFTITSSTFGGSPIYQWLKNSVPISGQANTTFGTSSITDGDIFSVNMISSVQCASPTSVNSNPITITVAPIITPSVTISSSATIICEGSPITLTASPKFGGAATYKWKLNNNYIEGATNSTYVTNAASNNDSYRVEMTNPATCANPSNVLSDPISITVNPKIVAAVAITTTSTSICAEDVVTFLSSVSSAGTSPSYVWFKNGSAIIPASTGAVYSTTSAVNGDKFKLQITSNAVCANPTTLFSNEFTMQVNSLPVITGSTDVCAGSVIALTGSGTANGSLPWASSKTGIATINSAGSLNGIAPGSTLITYTNNKGCSATTTVSVNEKPVITGTLSLCVNATSQLESTSTASVSNAWTSSNTSVATVSNSGLITGKFSGTTVITYKTILGCTNTVTVTVNELPVITGIADVCAGSSIQLTGSGSAASTSNLPWVSSNTGVASISNTGKLIAISSGTSLITYKNSNGCTVSKIVTVNPIKNPSVTLTANNSKICPGGSVTFTAAAVDGGTPTFKWKLGTTYIAGQTASTYTTSNVMDGNNYSVEMTSTVICATSSVVNSDPIVINVTANPTPTVIATSNTSNTICAGTSVTFTANPGNGGDSPTFQWKKNNVAITNETNLTYVSSTLVMGDKISVDMVGNSTCASSTNASSAPIIMTVNQNVSASVSILATDNTICLGENVQFTAKAVNGGTGALYEWFVGNVSQGLPTTSTTFSSISLINNNTVKVKLTSNAACVTNPTVNSTEITMTVMPKVTPIVSIAASKTIICNGVTVIFTANPQKQGSSPSYQWSVNGTNVGAATSILTFSTSTLADGDDVQVTLVSSETCVTKSSASSNKISMQVNSPTTIVSQPGTQSVCTLGDNITLSVGATGDNLMYQWIGTSGNLSNNATYAGVATKDLIIKNVQTVDLGNYSVKITGACGNVNSNTAALTLSTSSITIATQPMPQTKIEGEMIQLSVSATGPTLSYQWKKNGVNLVDDSRISGSNTASVQISNALVSDSDSKYSCLIMSPCATQIYTNDVSVTISSIATSIQNAQAKGFKIMPNPSNGRFNISNDYTPFSVNEIEIISMQGVVVASKTVNASTNLNEDIAAQDLPKGMYMILIKGVSDQALLKMVIDK